MSELVRRYRRRLPELSAALITAENIHDVAAWCRGRVDGEGEELRLLIGHTTVRAKAGDYVVEDESPRPNHPRQYYPIPGYLFEYTHQLIEDEHDI